MCTHTNFCPAKKPEKHRKNCCFISRQRFKPSNSTILVHKTPCRLRYLFKPPVRPYYSFSTSKSSYFYYPHSITFSANLSILYVSYGRIPTSSSHNPDFEKPNHQLVHTSDPSVFSAKPLLAYCSNSNINCVISFSAAIVQQTTKSNSISFFVKSKSFHNISFFLQQF